MPMTFEEFKRDMRQLATMPEPTDQEPGGHTIQDHTEHDGEMGMAMGAVLAGMRRCHKRACELVLQWSPETEEERMASPHTYSGIGNAAGDGEQLDSEDSEEDYADAEDSNEGGAPPAA